MKQEQKDLLIQAISLLEPHQTSDEIPDPVKDQIVSALKAAYALEPKTRTDRVDVSIGDCLNHVENLNLLMPKVKGYGRFSPPSDSFAGSPEHLMTLLKSALSGG